MMRTQNFLCNQELEACALLRANLPEEYAESVNLVEDVLVELAETQHSIRPPMLTISLLGNLKQKV
jgi:hypothetical protein